MRLLLLKLVSRMRYSYWFVPTLMVAGAAGLALLLGWVDGLLQGDTIDEPSWFYSGSPDGARSLLSTVASSMITVAGVVFSVTIVALTLASSQFGPRLLRNFIRDRGNQITLGTFLATFVYCLLVLRTIRGTDSVHYVPELSVTVGVLLALVSLMVLIYFIHHAASSIQAPNVLAAVASDLERSIDALFPEEIGVGAPAGESGGASRLPRDLADNSADVCAHRSGYVQVIDDAGLMSTAKDADIIVSVVCRPGDFVTEGHPLVRVWPRSRCSDEVVHELRTAFAIDRQRSVEQDVAFAVEQLVSVGVRALSPGINDPLTAIQCIDWLGAALSRLARRRLPPACRMDDEGRPRVIAQPLGFAEVLGMAFDSLRPYATSNSVVVARMLSVLELVAADATRQTDLAALADHARSLERQSRETLAQDRDHARVRRRFESVMHAIERAA